LETLPLMCTDRIDVAALDEQVQQKATIKLAEKQKERCTSGAAHPSAAYFAVVQ